MTLSIPFTDRHYRISSGYLALFFICWSLWWSLYAIWLKQRIGLTGAELGILYAINQTASIIFMLAYGVIQDKLGLRKILMWVVSAVLILTGPFMTFIYQPLLLNSFYLGAIIGSLFLGIGYLAGFGLVETFCEKISRHFHFEYGAARAWGSLGYALGAFIAGMLFRIDPNLNFWLISLFGVAFAFLNTRFTPPEYTEYQQNIIRRQDFIAVFNDKHFWIFVIFVIGTWSFYNIFDQQLFPIFYTQLFSSSALGAEIYSYLNASQVILEAFFMALIPSLVNRIGAKNALLLGVMIMAIRIFSCALSVNPYLISAVKLLHALEVPLCVIAVFKYSTLYFDKRLSSTIFLIGFQVASSIGVVLISYPLGALHDHYGYQHLFWIITAIVMTMLVFGMALLGRRQLQPGHNKHSSR
ncbi:oligosaccharide MFS transporter [Rosenbergiella australiborealis]|uniref:oligosaccharide MFS transporter n=1 Tax=Rosenbergiella australiborealis TaxID=1544696 RepID=UPI001F4EBAA7|nr:oligosaccharide MFS transporter [Rosenbergiella australiborealis]